MSKFKSQGFGNTFRNARKGLRIVLKAEKNIRIHFCIGMLVMFLGVYLGLSSLNLCVLLLAIALVIISEMLNSAIEFGLDAIFRNKYSKMVGFAKDISAGAVMLATFVAVIIGLIIFVPAICSSCCG